MSLGEILAEFCSDLEGARDFAELTGCLERLMRAAGFEHFIYYFPKIFGSPPGAADVVLLNYPLEWTEHYITRQYTRIDPVVTVASRGVLPADWADLPRNSRIVRTLFEEAAEAGVGRNGLSTPIHGAHGEVALLSFTSNETGEDWTQIKRQALPLVMAAAPFLHNRVVELTRPTEAAEPRLSLRERQCLYLRRQGMVSKEIARTLNVSHGLVTGYLGSARTKIVEAARSAETEPRLKGPSWRRLVATPEK